MTNKIKYNLTITLCLFLLLSFLTAYEYISGERIRLLNLQWTLYFFPVIYAATNYILTIKGIGYKIIYAALSFVIGYLLQFLFVIAITKLRLEIGLYI
jgi:hypothetical protein